VKDSSGPADTAMMGVMHDALRRDFTRARDVLATPSVLAGTQAQALAEHIRFMVAFLDAHHHTEDEKLWPLVRTHNPALGPLMEVMSQDHAAIAAQVDQLTGAAEQFGRAPDAGSRAELVAAIDRLAAVLWPHLDREETELMPRVSASLSGAQWHAFEKSAKPPFATRVLAEYLNWFLENLDPVRRHKVLKGLPAPIGLVSTRVFGRGYRRRAAVRWGTAPSAGTAGRRGIR
jgi:hemerythrin-like domain-containing protein